MMEKTPQLSPTTAKQRFVILDILRGFALMGICLANLPEFALWTFMSADAQAELPTWEVDRVVRFFQYVFVDGKFYTIFSLLFGIGFSIILEHALQRGSTGISLFFRRMTILILIGLVHLMFIWSGDILLLYALCGLLLPLLRRGSDKRLLVVALLLWFMPVAIDFFQELAGIRLAQPFIDCQWSLAERYGITEDNFATWLRDSDSYAGVFHFLIQGASERMSEFVDGHRAFKVLALFLLGYVIGRRRIYAQLDSCRSFMRNAAGWAWLFGLPFSVAYAWSAMNNHPLGLTVHALLYAISVPLLTAAYVSTICLADSGKLQLLSYPGRMALSNYIMQSLLGISLFYGVGLGLGCSVGLAYVELIAIVIFLFQIVMSKAWLAYFRFGPLEWIWRMLTYGRFLSMKDSIK